MKPSLVFCKQRVAASISVTSTKYLSCNSLPTARLASQNSGSKVVFLASLIPVSARQQVVELVSSGPIAVSSDNSVAVGRGPR
jgi:hypothetical protein